MGFRRNLALLGSDAVILARDDPLDSRAPHPARFGVSDLGFGASDSDFGFGFWGFGHFGASDSVWGSGSGFDPLHSRAVQPDSFEFQGSGSGSDSDLGFGSGLWVRFTLQTTKPCLGIRGDSNSTK